MPTNQVTNQRKGGARAESDASTASESGMGESSGGSKISEIAEQAQDYAAQGISHMRESLSECTRDHEGSALLVSLGAGFGVGLVIGVALSSAMSSRKPRTWRDRMAAEGIGRKIMDQLESMVPEALAERFGK